MSVEFTQVKDIIEEWKNKFKIIGRPKEGEDYKYKNCLRTISEARDLVEFLRASEPTLRIWMNEFLSKNRKNIFIQTYSSIILHWTKDLNLKYYLDRPEYLHVKEEWDKIFGSQPAYCFSLMEKVIFAASERLQGYGCEFIKYQDLCDDLTILALHEGQQCHGDEWDGCYTCNTQYDLWKAELMRRINECQHPLLNPKARCYWRMNECFEKNPLPDNWEPPHKWCADSIHYCSKSHPLCHSFDQICDKMRNTFSITYASKGYTPMNACSSFLFDLQYLAMMNSFDGSKEPKEYEVFDFLWNSLDIIRESYDLVLERAKEIEDMF